MYCAQYISIKKPFCIVCDIHINMHNSILIIYLFILLLDYYKSILYSIFFVIYAILKHKPEWNSQVNETTRNRFIPNCCFNSKKVTSTFDAAFCTFLVENEYVMPSTGPFCRALTSYSQREAPRRASSGFHVRRVGFAHVDCITR